MAIFLNEDDALSSEGHTSFAEMAPTSSYENWNASTKAIWSADATDSNQYNLREKLQEAAKIAQKFGSQITSPLEDVDISETNLEAPRSQADRMHEYWNSTLPSIFKLNPKVQAAFKNAGIDSEENFYKTINLDTKQAQQHHALVARNSNGLLATAANYAGGGFAYISDPMMQAALPFSLAYSLPSGLAAQALKVGYMETIINGIAETGIQSIVQPNKQKMGFEDAGLDEAINKIGIIMAASAVLGPVIIGATGGIAKAYPKVVNVLEGLPTHKLGELAGKFKKSRGIQTEIKTTDAIIDEAPLAMKSVGDENPLVKTPEGISEHAARNDAIVTRIATDEKPLTIGPMPATPIDEKIVQAAKTEIDNLKGFKTTVKASELEFDAGVFQYKSSTDIEGVSPKLKDVQVWDEVAAGNVMIYEFAPKINYKTGDVVTISSKGEKATIDKNFFINKEASENVDDLNKFIITTADGKTGTITLTKLKEFNKGRKVIVDGHQRLGLAKKLEKQGQKIELSAWSFREVDGVTPDMAKLKGVITNLRNGTGEAVDAVYVLKNAADINWETLKKSLPRKELLVVRAEGMMKASDEALSLFHNNKAKYSEDIISSIGEHITNKELHLNLLIKLSSKKFASRLEMEIALKQINDIPTAKITQESLFGTEILEESLIFERADLLHNAIKEIKSNKRIFATLNKNEKEITGAGNTLNKETNLTKELTYGETLDKISTTANRVGQLSDDLNVAAGLLKQGNRAEAKRATMEAIESANKRGDFNSFTTSRPVSSGPASNANKEFVKTEEGINNNFHTADDIELVVAPKPTRETIAQDIAEHGSYHKNFDPIKKEIAAFDDELGLNNLSLGALTKEKEEILNFQVPQGVKVAADGSEIVESKSMKDILKKEKEDDNFQNLMKDC